MTALPRFTVSVAAMTERYPTLEFRTEVRHGKPLAVWEGWLTPIRSRHELNAILCDLDEDRPVRIGNDATIRHDPACDPEHPLHPLLHQLKRPDRSFRVRIEFDGGPAHPAGFLLDPVVTPETRYHIFGENRVCAYAPWSDAWRAVEHTAADFTDHVLIWLFKWNVWVETNHWLGKEEDHTPLHLLTTIRPDMQCWCSNGEPYGRCHRPQDVRRAAAEIADLFAASSRLKQEASIDPATYPTLAAFLRNGGGKPRS